MSLVKIDYKLAVDLGIKVLTFMSWSRIAKAVVIAAITIGGYSVWENRQPIYRGIVSYNAQRSMIQSPLSKPTLAAVQELLDKPSVIVAIQLVSVDFRTNTRKTELFQSKLPALQLVMDTYQSKKIVNTPFFTDDTSNNLRNTSLINGEFVCYQIQEVAVFKRVPSLGSYAKTICSVSIPPYPGYFSGYVNIYLEETPSANDLQDIKAAIRKLSLVTFDAEFPK